MLQGMCFKSPLIHLCIYKFLFMVNILHHTCHTSWETELTFPFNSFIFWNIYKASLFFFKIPTGCMGRQSVHYDYGTSLLSSRVYTVSYPR